MEHIIDAKDKVLGRVASEAASLLLGKNMADFAKNKISGNKVKIINTSLAKINVKKFKTKNYISYSGYPGGLKKEKMEKLAGRKGYGELFKIAIAGMLANTKLKKEMLKNLTVTE